MFIGGFFIFIGNAYSQESVIGNSYLWQENITTLNYSFEREFNWQYTFLANNQVIVHKYHYANSNPRRITHANLTHYSWKLKDKNLVVQRFWRDSKGKEMYVDYLTLRLNVMKTCSFTHIMYWMDARHTKMFQTDGMFQITSQASYGDKL